MLPHNTSKNPSLPGVAGGFTKGGATLGFNGPMLKYDTQKGKGVALQTKKAGILRKSDLAPQYIKAMEAFAKTSAGVKACAKAHADVAVADKELKWAEFDLANDAGYIDAHLAFLAKMNKRANAVKSWLVPSLYEGGFESDKTHLVEGTIEQRARWIIDDAKKYAVSWLRSPYYRYADQYSGNPKIPAYAGIPNVQPTEAGTKSAWYSNRQFFDYSELWGGSQFAQQPKVAQILDEAREYMKKKAFPLTDNASPPYPGTPTYRPISPQKDDWAAGPWWVSVAGSAGAKLDLYSQDPRGWGPGTGCGAGRKESSKDIEVDIFSWQKCVIKWNEFRITQILKLMKIMRDEAEMVRKINTTWSKGGAWAKEIKRGWEVGTLTRSQLYMRLKSRGVLNSDVPGGYDGYVGQAKVKIGSSAGAYLQFVQAVADAKKEQRRAENALTYARCYNMSTSHQTAAKAQGEMDAAVVIAGRAADRAEGKMDVVKALWKTLAKRADQLYGYCKGVHDLDPFSSKALKVAGPGAAQLIMDRVNECAKNPKKGSPAYILGVLQEEYDQLEDKFKACSSILGKNHADCQAVKAQMDLVQAKLDGMSEFTIAFMELRSENREQAVEKRTGDDGVYASADEAIAACIKAQNSEDVFYVEGDDPIAVKLTPEQQQACADAIAKAEKAKKDANLVGSYVSAWGQQLLGLNNKFNLGLPGYVKKKIVKNEDKACKAGADCPCPTGQVRKGDLCLPIDEPLIDDDDDEEEEEKGFPWGIAALVAVPVVLGLGG